MAVNQTSRRSDAALAGLLLVIGIPRATEWFLDRPIETEGVIAQMAIVLALLILIWRNTGARTAT